MQHNLPSRLARFLVWTVLNIAVTVVAIEIVLRVVRPYNDWLNSVLYLPVEAIPYEDIHNTEELLGRSILGRAAYRTRCGFVHNSKGFRTYEYSQKKADNVFRVVAIGDSFTYASGCVPWNNFWPVRLQAILNKQSDRQVEVISLGVPGVGTPFERAIWELEAKHLNPDLVVLAFFVGNDFADELPPYYPSGAPLENLSYCYRFFRNLFILHKESLLQDSFLQTRRYKKGGFLIEGWGKNFDENKQGMNENTFMQSEWGRLHLVRKSWRNRFDNLFEGSIRHLQDFKRAVEGSGSQFLVMIIPDEYQVNHELRRDLLKRFNTDEADIDLDLPQRKLKEFFDKTGIRHLDLLPAFQEHGGITYIPRNTHWNSTGNILAAELLSAAIRVK